MQRVITFMATGAQRGLGPRVATIATILARAVVCAEVKLLPQPPTQITTGPGREVIEQDIKWDSKQS